MSTCQARTPDSRAATGLSPTANRSRPNPLRRSPMMITAASGTKTGRLFGRNGSVVPEPSKSMIPGSDDAGVDHRQLVDVHEPEDDQADPEGHDQRVDLEHPDADAIREPDERRRG